MLVRLALHAMGTRFELVLEGDGDGPAAEAHLRAVGEEALAEVPGVSQVTVSHIGGACRSVRAHVTEAGEESSS